MDFQLEKDFLTNNTRYFFSLLDPRFEIMNKLMSDSLSHRFGYEYKPIYIFSSHPNKYYKKENYIILNKHANRIERELKKKVVDVLEDDEELNEEFSRSPFVEKLANQLFKKQDRLPVYAFTSSFLNLTDPRWLIIGPIPKIATYYDNKIQHYELFKKLKLPRIYARIYKNRHQLLKAKDIFPGYIAASYTSGGCESGPVYHKEMLLDFFARIRKVNIKEHFLVARIFENIVISPNVNAIVTDKNKTSVLIISDQIMDGNRYIGNVYPSSIGQKHIEEIKKITIKIGNNISREGYRGLFGCDFLINKKGRLVTVDLNPRRQGGYTCNALALKAVGIDITTIELSCALGEIPNVDLAYKKIQYPTAWAHTKVKPHDPGRRIVKETRRGDISRIFIQKSGDFQGTFYKKGSIFIKGSLGYVVSVGKHRKKIYGLVADSVDALSTSILA